MAKTQRTRVGAFSTFEWQNNVIGFCQQVQVVSPQAVAPPQVVQPLGSRRPVEIVTAGAIGNGTLTLQLTELYNEAIWQRLSGFANSVDLADIMLAVAQNNDDGGIQVRKVVRPPQGLPGAPSYSETYYNCVIASIEDGETVDVTTQKIDKNVEIWFTHSKKSFFS